MILTLLLICFAAARADAGQEIDIASLTRRALAGDTELDANALDTIGGVRSRLALNSLFDCCERGSPALRPAAFYALRHFFGVPDLQETAVAFLTEHSLGKDGRSATRTLVRFASVAPEALERIVLESDDPMARQQAVGGIVEKLVSRGTPEALELLLEHYLPPISGSMERGALSLASFRTDEDTKLLLKTAGLSRTPSEVRAMIMTGLALRPGKSVTSALQKALRQKEPLIVVAAIEALRQRQETGHLRELKSLTRSKSAGVRRAAFHSLTSARYPSVDFAKQLDAALEGRDFALRMGLASAFGAEKNPASARILATLIDDENTAVRREAIRQSTARHIRDAIPHLIARLEQDGSRLRALAYQALENLTGLDHGPTAERWRAWWAQEGERFELPDKERARSMIRERRTRRLAVPTQSKPSFYGVRFASDRVVFVLDVSGSMTEFGKLERMKREVLEALEQIPDGSTFNLIFFGSQVHPWGESLLKMKEEIRERARRSVKALEYLGGTNLHGGLRAAFKDPNVETIVLLSDGEPTEGVTQYDRILRDVRRWNDLRGVVVHSVAVGWDGSLLRAISAGTGGEASSGF